jgi:phosphoribosylanthranilate isomerase
MATQEYPPLPFRIKICGITSLDDATMAIGRGAEALGLNFYPKSKRCVSLETAAEIALFYSTTVPIVAVTVNFSLEEIFQIISAAVDFGWIQFHGDETPEFLAQVKKELNLPLIRAFRWQHDSGHTITSYLDRCSELGCLPNSVLIDAFKPGEFGGTGALADWDAIADWRDQSGLQIPIVLAGGLNAENVVDAIARVRPDAVDTASGVESSPGQKDGKLVANFVAASKQAFSNL